MKLIRLTSRLIFNPVTLANSLVGSVLSTHGCIFVPTRTPSYPFCSPPAAGTLPIIQHDNQPNGGGSVLHVPVGALTTDSGGTPNNTTHHDPPPSFLALKKDL